MKKQTRLCYICRKSNHLAKDCYYRNKNTHSPSTSQRNNSSRNGHVFIASHREEKLCDNTWILDSGASCHMAKESVWLKNISPEVMDIYLADKNSKMMSQGTGNVSAKTVSTKHCNSINLTITDVSYVPQLRSKYENLTDKRIKKIRTDNGLEFVNEQLDTYLANSGIFHEKTIPYNSESNGKAERANRVLLERARSLLYESKLPLKFWAEAINYSTQVSIVTPRKGKEKISLEIWTGTPIDADLREQILKLGPYQPEGNFQKDAKGRSFSSSYNSFISKAGQKIERKWLCYSTRLHVAYCQEEAIGLAKKWGITPEFEKKDTEKLQFFDDFNADGKLQDRERLFKVDVFKANVDVITTQLKNRFESEIETWDIDSFFEVSPERNEINQNTENGVLSNFDINNGPVAIENNSIPLQTTSSPQDRQNPNSDT
ncbi:retrovirus-related Pol polyprotein from transposon TNT 1-94 [Trichonephila clavipes]|nr:retrovirus-related Pol polyprotein from transposon TNT 1-94 [Trichonephila clavipes]